MRLLPWLKLYWLELAKTAVVLVFGVLVLMLVTGCGTMDPYARVQLGHVITDVQGSDGVGFLGSVGTQGKHHFCEYTHFSMVNRGSPWDSRIEPHLDHIGCGVQFGGK